MRAVIDRYPLSEPNSRLLPHNLVVDQSVCETSQTAQLVVREIGSDFKVGIEVSDQEVETLLTRIRYPKTPKRTQTQNTFARIEKILEECDEEEKAKISAKILKELDLAEYLDFENDVLPSFRTEIENIVNERFEERREEFLRDSCFGL